MLSQPVVILTPTSPTSWLDKVEVWSSILARAAIRGASHRSPRQVRDAIERFTVAYDEVATPFELHQREVHQGRPHSTLR